MHSLSHSLAILQPRLNRLSSGTGKRAFDRRESSQSTLVPPVLGRQRSLQESPGSNRHIYDTVSSVYLDRLRSDLIHPRDIIKALKSAVCISDEKTHHATRVRTRMPQGRAK